MSKYSFLCVKNCTSTGANGNLTRTMLQTLFYVICFCKSNECTVCANAAIKTHVS